MCNLARQLQKVDYPSIIYHWSQAYYTAEPSSPILSDIYIFQLKAGGLMVAVTGTQAVHGN